DVPTEPLPLTGRETGLDVGLKVFLITADGQRVENSRHYRKAERALKKAQQAPQEGGAPARQEASEGTPAAAGLPPQDGARARAPVRRALSGRPPGAQPASPP